MSSNPARMSIVLIGRDDDRLALLEETLQEYYRCTLERVRRDYAVKRAYQEYQPDFVVVDTRMSDLVESFGNYEMLIPEMKNVPLVLMIDSSEDRENIHIPLTVAGYLSPEYSRKQILGVIDRLARMSGYSLDTGELENRLVRRQLSIELQTNSGKPFAQGKSTGLDFDELHARVNSDIEDIDPPELEGAPCKVRFLDPDVMELQVMAGRIKQVGESWEPGFKFFVAFSFDPDDPAGFRNNSMAAEILSTLIENQREHSVRIKTFEEESSRDRSAT